jgi:uncharacterized protein YodC (DUF2158 family)
LADSFNTGDLVQLKSGGPVMTVEGMVLGSTETVWFAYGKRRHGLFEPRALKAAVVAEEKTEGSVAKMARETRTRAVELVRAPCVIE